tara:strand:- start:5132 stop:5848 length:717 start_codon:yes stop_codon:yes gene_type:complete
MLWMVLLAFIGVSLAEPKLAEGHIVVEANKDFEVYIAPTKVKNAAPGIEAVIGDYSVFGYASMHSRNAQIQNGTGGHEPLSLNHNNFKVYNKDTINYVWDNCNYIRDAKKCSFDNNHYLIETYITIDSNQIVIEIFLYDPELQIIARGSKTSTLETTWIKQQSVQTIEAQEPLNVQSQPRNCIQGDCYPVQGLPAKTIVTDSPKEEMPLRWEIPHMLLDEHVNQAMLGLWIGVKIKIY